MGHFSQIFPSCILHTFETLSAFVVQYSKKRPGIFLLLSPISRFCSAKNSTTAPKSSAFQRIVLFFVFQLG